MIRCDNCGTNNMDGSEFCDECGTKLDIVPHSHSRRRDSVPVYQPPSAVENEPVVAGTMDAPLPTPPSFTTSTSVPKPAMPARERRPGNDVPASANARRSLTNERSGPAFKSSERVDRAGSPETFALSSRPKTGELEGGSGRDGEAALALARLIIERGGRIGKEFP